MTNPHDPVADPAAAISAWLRQHGGSSLFTANFIATQIDRGGWRANLPAGGARAPEPTEARAALEDNIGAFIAAMAEGLTNAEVTRAIMVNVDQYATLKAAYVVRTAPAAGEAEPKPEPANVHVGSNADRSVGGSGAYTHSALSPAADLGPTSDFLGALEAALGPLWKQAEIGDKVAAADEEAACVTYGDLRRAREAHSQVLAAIAAARAGSGENIFGKQRCRFDEAGARLADRSLPEAAMASLAAMPESEWPRFVEMFNRAFRWGSNPRQITAVSVPGAPDDRG